MIKCIPWTTSSWNFRIQIFNQLVWRGHDL